MSRCRVRFPITDETTCPLVSFARVDVMRGGRSTSDRPLSDRAFPVKLLDLDLLAAVLLREDLLVGLHELWACA